MKPLFDEKFMKNCGIQTIVQVRVKFSPPYRILRVNRLMQEFP